MQLDMTDPRSVLELDSHAGLIRLSLDPTTVKFQSTLGLLPGAHFAMTHWQIGLKLPLSPWFVVPLDSLLDDPLPLGFPVDIAMPKQLVDPLLAREGIHFGLVVGAVSPSFPVPPGSVVRSALKLGEPGLPALRAEVPSVLRVISDLDGAVTPAAGEDTAPIISIAYISELSCKGWSSQSLLVASSCLCGPVRPVGYRESPACYRSLPEVSRTGSRGYSAPYRRTVYHLGIHSAGHHPGS